MKLLVKILYKCISFIDWFEYKFINNKLTDGYKTIKELDISGISARTDTGYKPVSKLMFSRPFEQYTVSLENGYSLICADRHILFDSHMNEVFVEDLTEGDYVQTDKGPIKIASILKNPTKVSMGDLTIDDDNHRFFTNNILSHNSTTTAIYALWKILFNTDKAGLILSKSGPAGADLLSKIKDMYRYLPYHLKCGTMKWNQSSISFDNNSSISTEAFSPTAGLGKTINFLILDEFAWCPPNDVDLFYNNIIPTVTTISDSNVCIMSTQNGFNLFYKLVNAASKGENIYSLFVTNWWEVPQFNTETHGWDKRDDKWKKTMIGVLGSEEAFDYQYGTKFAASNDCLVSRECLSKLHDIEREFKTGEDFDIPLLHKNRLYWNPDFDLEELKTGWFVLLADLAEGGGNDTIASPDSPDSTVFQILQYLGEKQFKQVGYWKSNAVDLENAALEFWILCATIFNNDRCIYSIEWNTYGALFYQYLMNLNEPEYRPEHQWRFKYANIDGEGFDNTRVAYYKKQSVDDAVPGVSKTKAKTVPGIRWSGESKKMACSLLKMEIEKQHVQIIDRDTISELENFEDKNGNGSYAARYGHDDLIMTFVQIPMLVQTPKFKDWDEEYNSGVVLGNLGTPDIYSAAVDYNSIGSPFTNPFTSEYPFSRFNQQDFSL